MAKSKLILYMRLPIWAALYISACVIGMRIYCRIFKKEPNLEQISRMVVRHIKVSGPHAA